MSLEYFVALNWLPLCCYSEVRPGKKIQFHLYYSSEKLWESRYGLAPFGVLCRQRFEYDVCDRHKNLVKRTETKSHRGASGYYTWQ